MSTHGDILILDEGDSREDGIWLHAYSDGHVHDVFEMLTELPEWFVKRAELANELKDPSLGKGWVIDQYEDRHWRNCLCVNLGAYKSHLAALLCARYLDRWMPMHESEAPWHKIGEHPDIIIQCSDGGIEYELIPNPDYAEDGLEKTTVEWMDRLRKGFKAAKAKAPNASVEADEEEQFMCEDMGVPDGDSSNS